MVESVILREYGIHQLKYRKAKDLDGQEVIKYEDLSSCITLSLRRQRGSNKEIPFT